MFSQSKGLSPRQSSVSVFALLYGILCVTSPHVVHAAEVNTDTRIQVLEQRILELEERLVRLAQQAAQPPAQVPTPVTPPANTIRTSEDGGYALTSPATGNELRFSGIVQLDYRYFANGATSNGAALDDGFLLRRIRPTFSGRFGGVGFRVVPELSGNGTGTNVSLLDAFVDVPSAWGGFFRVGKQKTAVSIDRIRVATALPLIERGLANELAPNRDLGVAYNAQALQGRVQWVAGFFNGAADGRDVSARDDDGKEIQGRVFVEPFKLDTGVLQGLGLGVSFTHGNKNNSSGNASNTQNTLPRYRTAGQEEFFSYSAGVTAAGTHQRVFPQLSYYRNNWGVVAEYGVSQQDLSRAGFAQTVSHTGYDITANWVITGQPVQFRGVALADDAPFPRNAGAVELAFRVSGLNIDDSVFSPGASRLADPDLAARSARNLGVGLNWYLSKNTKWSVDFNSTQFQGGALGGANREEEQAIFSRLQFVY